MAGQMDKARSLKNTTLKKDPKLKSAGKKVQFVASVAAIAKAGKGPGARIFPE